MTENEKTKDSRLAREFVVALPIELSEAQWEKLLSDFISDTFVADGMCADVAIHDPTPSWSQSSCSYHADSVPVRRKRELAI